MDSILLGILGVGITYIFGDDDCCCVDSVDRTDCIYTIFGISKKTFDSGPRPALFIALTVK